MDCQESRHLGDHLQWPLSIDSSKTCGQCNRLGSRAPMTYQEYSLLELLKTQMTQVQGYRNQSLSLYRSALFPQTVLLIVPA